MRSSSALRERTLRGVAFGALLAAGVAACAQQRAAAPADSPGPAGGSSHVGYVRMDALVKVHPLYSQLARLDEDLQALQLSAVGPEVASAGSNIDAERRALESELDAAAARTKAALGDKQQAYAKREQAAIDAALAAASGSRGPGGGDIASGVAAISAQQAQRVREQAAHNFDAYRGALVAQNNAAVASLDRSLAERAAREYRARADEVSRKEADLALQLASEDSAERLSLRTKLSNLALDDASRADVKKELDALDRKEADAVAALKNRDQETLAALQKRLHDDVHGEMVAQVAQLRDRTNAKIAAREKQVRGSLVAQTGAVASGNGVAVPSGIAPDMRAKLQALHAKYQRDFNADATRTIAQFQKTRADLSRRFAQLANVDGAARSGANQQMSALQKQRGDLYNEMVAQIGREVKVIAQKRGISVVVGDVVAPANGVDLTGDATKDIESLHE